MQFSLFTSSCFLSQLHCLLLGYHPSLPCPYPKYRTPYLYLCFPNLADIKSDPLGLSLPQTIACKSDRTEAREATIQGPWSFKIGKLQKIARDEMKSSLRVRREILSIYREENCLLLMNCQIVRQDWQDRSMSKYFLNSFSLIVLHCIPFILHLFLKIFISFKSISVRDILQLSLSHLSNLWKVIL